MAEEKKQIKETPPVHPKKKKREAFIKGLVEAGEKK